MAVDVQAVFAKIRGKIDKIRSLNTGLARGEFTNVGDVSIQIGNTVSYLENNMGDAEKEVEAE